jgi:hypothetical protein
MNFGIIDFSSIGFNELLYYGGILTVAASVVIAVIVFIITYISGLKLKMKFDEEYGEVPKSKRK